MPEPIIPAIETGQENRNPLPGADERKLISDVNILKQATIAIMRLLDEHLLKMMKEQKETTRKQLEKTNELLEKIHVTIKSMDAKRAK